MKGRCDCGKVTITVQGLPDKINACPCEYCRRVGAHWGYYDPGEVEVSGETHVYQRASRRIEFHRCATCGVVSHWVEPTGELRRMGVHMENFDREALQGVRRVVEP